MTIQIKQGLILKSSDEEYVYNIFAYTENSESMIVDILNKNLETIATRKWLVKDFKEQLELGTIIEFKEGDTIGE